MHRIATEKLGKTSFKLLKWLLKNHPELLLETDSTRKSPLHIAIEKNKLNFVKTLLKHVQDLDAVLDLSNVMGNNCLHMAIKKNLCCAEDLPHREMRFDQNLH